PDGLGRGEEDDKGRTGAVPASRFVSRGLMRGKADNLYVLPERAMSAGPAPGPVSVVGTRVATATATATATQIEYQEMAVAAPAPGGGAGLVTRAERQLLDAPVVTAVQAAIERLDGQIQQVEQEQRAREAKLKGFEGDNCHSCGNFTLVRNGTCLKCVTCG